MTAAYPRMPFAQHMREIGSRWKQGEHLTVCGPTSSGKTTLVRPLLDVRANRGGHIVALFTKWQDETISNEFGGYTRFDRWPKRVPQDVTKMMIWPTPEKTLKETRAKHREVMAEALDKVAREGKRCLYIDETLYLCNRSFGNLSPEIEQIHYFARSSKVSAVTTAQRPFHIPRVIMSSVSHAYLARTRDKDDAARLAELSNVNPKELAAQLAALPTRHDFIYVNTQGDAEPVIINTRQ